MDRIATADYRCESFSSMRTVFRNSYDMPNAEADMYVEESRGVCITSRTLG
jgi:hypothetical protein